MVRIVKEDDYTSRRNEILDVARQLVYSKGYEQMSIQDVLDILKISKGAFYHYFPSKLALLDALVERIVNEAEQNIFPILDDMTLPALEKLQRFFRTAVQWKTSQKEFLLGLLRVWYSDDNAIIRHKTFNNMQQKISPSFSNVIRQGLAEGTMNTESPNHATEICFYIFQGLGEKFSEVILNIDKAGGLPYETRLRNMEEAMEAYTRAVERILGAPCGSMQFMDLDSIQKWVE